MRRGAGLGVISILLLSPPDRICPKCRNFFFFTLRVLGVSASPSPSPPSKGLGIREIPAANSSREGKSSCVETCMLDMVLEEFSKTEPMRVGWLLGVATTTSLSSSVVLDFDRFVSSFGDSERWGAFFFFFFLFCAVSSKKGVPSGSKGGSADSRVLGAKILSPSSIFSDWPSICEVFCERDEWGCLGGSWFFKEASSSLRFFFSAFRLSS